MSRYGGGETKTYTVTFEVGPNVAADIEACEVNSNNVPYGIFKHLNTASFESTDGTNLNVSSRDYFLIEEIPEKIVIDKYVTSASYSDNPTLNQPYSDARKLTAAYHDRQSEWENSKKNNPYEVKEGGALLTYTITVTNEGKRPAHGSLTDSYNANLRNLKVVSGGSIPSGEFTLAVGETKTFNITLEVNEYTLFGNVLENMAIFKSSDTSRSYSSSDWIRLTEVPEQIEIDKYITKIEDFNRADKVITPESPRANLADGTKLNSAVRMNWGEGKVYYTITIKNKGQREFRGCLADIFNTTFFSNFKDLLGNFPQSATQEFIIEYQGERTYEVTLDGRSGVPLGIYQNTARLQSTRKPNSKFESSDYVRLAEKNPPIINKYIESVDGVNQNRSGMNEENRHTNLVDVSNSNGVARIVYKVTITNPNDVPIKGRFTDYGDSQIQINGMTIASGTEIEIAPYSTIEITINATFDMSSPDAIYRNTAKFEEDTYGTVESVVESSDWFKKKTPIEETATAYLKKYVTNVQNSPGSFRNGRESMNVTQKYQYPAEVIQGSIVTYRVDLVFNIKYQNLSEFSEHDGQPCPEHYNEHVLNSISCIDTNEDGLLYRGISGAEYDSASGRITWTHVPIDMNTEWQTISADITFEVVDSNMKLMNVENKVSDIDFSYSMYICRLWHHEEVIAHNIVDGTTRVSCNHTNCYFDHEVKEEYGHIDTEDYDYVRLLDPEIGGIVFLDKDLNNLKDGDSENLSQMSREQYKHVLVELWNRTENKMVDSKYVNPETGVFTFGRVRKGPRRTVTEGTVNEYTDIGVGNFFYYESEDLYQYYIVYNFDGERFEAVANSGTSNLNPTTHAMNDTFPNDSNADEIDREGFNKKLTTLSHDRAFDNTTGVGGVELPYETEGTNPQESYALWDGDVNSVLNLKAQSFDLYYPDGDVAYLRYINLGLRERPKANITLTKDVLSAEVTINGYRTYYEFGKLGTGDYVPEGRVLKTPYVLRIYREDYEFRTSNYDPELQDIMNENNPYRDYGRDNDLQIIIEYKIVVKNESDAGKNAVIREIVDYTSKELEIIDSFTLDGQALSVSTTSKFQNPLQSPSKCNQYFITGEPLENKVLAPNESFEITVKAKVMKDSNGYIYADLATDTLSNIKANVAEIGAYSICDDDGKPSGLIDKNSNPGNVTVKDDEFDTPTFEDDTFGAGLVVELRDKGVPDEPEDSEDPDNPQEPEIDKYIDSIGGVTQHRSDMEEDEKYMSPSNVEGSSGTTEIVYKVDIYNPGDTDLVGTFTDYSDRGIRIISMTVDGTSIHDGSQITVGPKETKTVVIEAEFDLSYGGGRYRNTASFSFDFNGQPTTKESTDWFKKKDPDQPPGTPDTEIDPPYVNKYIESINGEAQNRSELNEDEKYRSFPSVQGADGQVTIVYKVKIYNQNNSRITGRFIDYSDSEVKITSMTMDGREISSEETITLEPKETKEITITATFDMTSRAKMYRNTARFEYEVDGKVTPSESSDWFRKKNPDQPPGTPDTEAKRTAYRNISGIVFEEMTKSGVVDGETVGDGKMDKDDIPAKNVLVKLFEVIRKKAADGSVAQEYFVDTGMWFRTGDDGRYYFGDNVDENLKSTGEHNSIDDRYRLHPGIYVVRFAYGAESPFLETDNGTTVRYSGQDYKSVKYTDAGNMSDPTETLEVTAFTNLSGNNNGPFSDSFDTTLGPNVYSLARDNEIRRLEVNNYSTTMTYPMDSVLKATQATQEATILAERTAMFADTKAFNMEIEYYGNYPDPSTKVMDGTRPLEEFYYSVRDVNFGLIERPKTKLQLMKDITEMKAVTSDGRTLIDIFFNVKYTRVDTENGITIEHKSEGDFERSVGSKNVQILNRNGNNQGFRYANIDSSLLQGMTITIKYQIAIANTSEVDHLAGWLQERIENEPDVGIDIGYGLDEYSATAMPYRDNSFVDILRGQERTYSYDRSYLNRLIHSGDSSLGINPLENADNGFKLYSYLGRDYIGSDNIKKGYTYKNIVKNVKSDYKYGDFVGNIYYTNSASGNETRVSTRIDQYVDFVDNDLIFKVEENVTDDGQVTHLTYTAEDIAREGLLKGVTDQTTEISDGSRNFYSSKENTNNNLAFNIPDAGINSSFYGFTKTITLDNGATVSSTDDNFHDYFATIEIQASRTLTSEIDAEGIAIDNLAEIVKVTNTAGRKVYVKANKDSSGNGFIGNSLEKVQNWNKPGSDETPVDSSKDETDTDFSETVTFSPPTGLSNRDRTLNKIVGVTTKVLLIAIPAVIIIVGITYVVKVTKKKKLFK